MYLTHTHTHFPWRRKDHVLNLDAFPFVPTARNVHHRRCTFRWRVGGGGGFGGRCRREDNGNKQSSFLLQNDSAALPLVFRHESKVVIECTRTIVHRVCKIAYAHAPLGLRAPLDGWPSITLSLSLFLPRFLSFPVFRIKKKKQSHPRLTRRRHDSWPSHPLTSSPRPRVGIKSATHQPSGYLKSLSVDRLRYRRCFVRELVARLHDPSLSSLEYIPWSRSEKRGRKIEREICTVKRERDPAIPGISHNRCFL